MNRQEFIITIMNKVLKPALYLVLILFGINFLKNAYNNESSIERGFIYAGLLIITFIFIMNIASFFFYSVKAKLPEKINLFISKSIQILEYALIPFLIYICYNNWSEIKWKIIPLFICYLLILFYKKIRQTIEV